MVVGWNRIAGLIGHTRRWERRLRAPLFLIKDSAGSFLPDLQFVNHIIDPPVCSQIVAQSLRFSGRCIRGMESPAERSKGRNP